MKQEPYYRSTAVLRVTENNNMPGVGSSGTGGSFQGSDYYAIQQNLLKSPSILNRAQERMSVTVTELNQAIRGIEVKPTARTGTIRINVMSFKPVIGSQFANMIAEEYLEYKTEERIDNSQNNVITLTQQANKIRDELRKAEEKLQAFRRQNSILAIGGQSNVAATHLSRMTTKAAEYRTDRMLLEAQQPFLDEAPDDIILRALAGDVTGINTDVGFSGSTGGGSNLVNASRGGVESLLDNDVVKNRGGWQSAKRERARLQAHMENLRSKFKDNHPRVQTVMNRLNELELELQVELQFALEEYNSKLDTLTLKENAVRSVAAQWEVEAQRVANKRHDLSLLERNQTRLQNLYEVVFSDKGDRNDLR